MRRVRVSRVKFVVEKHCASCRGAVVSPRCLLPHTLVLRPTWMPVEGVARNEGDARRGAARRGLARVDGGEGGRRGVQGEDGMTTRRGEAKRGEARRGERRPRATTATREARRGGGGREVGRLLRYGLGRVVRGGGSGRKGRGIPPLPSLPPTDHLSTLIVVTIVVVVQASLLHICKKKCPFPTMFQDATSSAKNERRRETSVRFDASIL